MIHIKFLTIECLLISMSSIVARYCRLVCSTIQLNSLQFNHLVDIFFYQSASN